MIPTENLNRLHYYLHERERIRLKKEANANILTEDPILQRYKFTNILRSDDRTTRWVKKNWYDPNRDQPKDVVALNCAIFRYFGTQEFAEDIGFQYSWDPSHLIETADRRMKERKKVFTGAYIITNGGISAPKQEVVVGNYLQPFRARLPDLVAIAERTNSWQSVGTAMRTLPGMGAFMTKEILLDMMLTPVLENAEDKLTWTPVGPGAIRGLNRLHERPVDQGLTQSAGLHEIKDLLGQISSMGLEDFMPKIGVEYGVTDLQFALCEYDKYERVRLGEGRPRSTYKKTERPLP